MRRNERRRARAEGRQPRTLLAADFLILVDDESRLGALRFKDDLLKHHRPPHLVEDRRCARCLLSPASGNVR